MPRIFPDAVRQLRNSARAALIAGSIVGLGGALSRSLTAQRPSAPADTTHHDLQPESDGLLQPALVAAVVVFAVAPPTLLLSPDWTNPDSTWSLADNHVAAYVTGGCAGSNQRCDWTHSENIDIVDDHLFGGLRLETFQVPDHVQLQTFRAGYLFHPKPALEGGVTLGYQHATGFDPHNAVEIGLPLTVGSERIGFSLAPAYLISAHGVDWTYRVQMEVYMLPPLTTGFIFEAKPLHHGGPYYASGALLFGFRWARTLRRPLP